MGHASTSGTGFGVDIGGSGIKGAPVDLAAGRFAAERSRVPTPQPSTPDAIAGEVADLVRSFGDAAGPSPIGVTFPAVIQHGVARTAANVDKSWIGTDVDALLTARLGRSVHVVNDADAAGLAEARFGADGVGGHRDGTGIDPRSWSTASGAEPNWGIPRSVGR
jgi:polyphosphate glucokinase